MKAFDLKSALPGKHAQPVALIHFRIALFVAGVKHHRRRLTVEEPSAPARRNQKHLRGR